MTKKTLLTVNIITYNHKDYIAQCIESILEQKTSFGFIVRIFDDCSTDGTTEICQRYAKKYPKKIFFFPNERNKGWENGVLTNVLRSYENITTPYYMYIEGDDFRLSKSGFQQQVEALEAHPECSFCSANVVNFRNGEFLDTHPLLHKGIYSKEYVIANPQKLFFSNLSARIVRTSCINIKKTNKNLYLTDNSQFYELLSQGSLYFVDKTLSVYRETGCGVATGCEVWQRIMNAYNIARSCDKDLKEMFQLNLLHFFSIDVTSFYLRELEKRVSAPSAISPTRSEFIKFSKKQLKSFRRTFFRLLLPGFVIATIHGIRDLSRKMKGIR